MGKKSSDTRFVDYYAVPVPADKDFKKFTYAERRAYLLRKTERLGDPKLIHRTKEAERFGVSVPQLTKDMQRLRMYLRDHIDKDDFIFRIDAVKERAIKAYVDAGEYDKAYNMLRDWGRFLCEMGEIERVPDKVDLTGGFEILIERFKPDEDEDNGDADELPKLQ